MATAVACFLLLQVSTLIQISGAVVVSAPKADDVGNAHAVEKAGSQLMRVAGGVSRVALTGAGDITPHSGEHASTNRTVQPGHAQESAPSLGSSTDNSDSTVQQHHHAHSYYSFLKGWDFQQHREVTKDCGSNLSGIGNTAVADAVRHKHIQAPSTNSPELAFLQSRRIFIAAHLHNAAGFLPHWSLELIRLLMALRRISKEGLVDNVYVSIVETASTTPSKRYLEYLRAHLEFLGVPSNIVQVYHGAHPKDAIAHARNKAVEPLRHSSRTYDQTIFLEARYFCADAALQAAFSVLPPKVGGLGADAVCGMDSFMTSDSDKGRQCNHVGMNENRDLAGQPFKSTNYVAGTSDVDNAQRQPFQVFSCWSALVVLSADVFQKHQLIFRTSRELLNECPTSESELFFRDMWNIGRGKAVVLPSVSTADGSNVFQHCSLQRQPTLFSHATPIEFQEAPEILSCCPAHASVPRADANGCYEDFWDRATTRVPRYQSSHLSPTLLIDGDLTVLISQARGSRLEMCAQSAEARLALVFAATFSLGVLVERFRFGNGNDSVVTILWLCGFSSLALHIVNKNAISLLPLPLTLVLVQILIAIVLLLAVFGGRKLTDEVLSNLDKARSWSLLTLPYVGVLITTMYSLRSEATATTILIAKNSLPIASLCLEWVFFPRERHAVTVQSCLALYCIALGTLVLTISNFRQEEAWATLLWIFLSSLLTLLHKFWQRRLLVEPVMTLSCPALLLVSNLTGFVLVLPLCLLHGEHRVWHSLHGRSILFEGGYGDWFCVVLSGCVATSLGYYTIMAQKQITPTTMLVLQATSRILLILVTMLGFSTSWYWSSMIGCVMTLSGCLLFLARVAWKHQGCPPKNVSISADSMQTGTAVEK
jgi:hypothetical protein